MREAEGGAMRVQGSFSQAEYAGKKKQTRRDKARFSEVCWGQITSFWLLWRLPRMAYAPSFPVRLTRERGDGTDGMRLGSRSD